MCVPIRVPVATFRPGKSQRRCWRKNQDLVISIGRPEMTDEKVDLYRRYIAGWHGRTEDPSTDDLRQFLYESPVDTAEFTYSDPAGRLLAVGICDVCDRSLSSVYFYFDPDHARRGLGTFGALAEIAHARGQSIPHYYLGYWVAGCGAMEYKTQFRPYELLGHDGVWR